MKIRRNYEGNMIFIDALELLNVCIENQILTGEVNKFAIVYHNAGENAPAGWYRHDIEELAREVMRDDEVIKLLINALSEKGIEFEPSFNASLLDSSLLQELDEDEGNVDDEAETVFDSNGCPENCPCLDDYPNCYCKQLTEDEEMEE